MKIRTKLIAGFLIVSILAAVEGFWVLYKLREVSKPLNSDIPLSIEHLSQTSETDGLVQLIRYYDEILTQSARNYAFTGNQRWMRRYYAFEPLLEATIRQAIEVCYDKDRVIFKQIDKTNITLIKMEIDALQQVEKGNRPRAIEILESDKYWDEKNIYEKRLREYFSMRGVQYEQAFESSMVTIRMAAKNAQSMLHSSLRWTMLFILVIITLSILIGFAITRSIVTPVNTLIHAAKKISGGDLSHRVELATIGEIGVLSDSFNKMTDSLTQANYKLEKARDELEKRVDERTRELKKANIQLHLEIAERKQAEEKLKIAKEEAESANRAKSEFLANMSHEIRTPMNAVIGFSNLLFNIVTDKQQKNYLESIQTAGKALMILLNDILDLSKIEAGRLELQYEAVNPLTVFMEMKQVFGMKTADKNLDFVIDISQDIPDTLLLDETRLRQVLFNLIGNAVKFTEKGYIKLSARKTDREESNRIDLLISVEDTGIGIPEDQKKIVFESFRQQDGQQNRKYGGTGLGLAITKRLVEIMNGRITIESRIGKGSIFMITLENIEISYKSPPAADSVFFDINLAEFKSSKILIVDDIKFNRSLLRESLILAGLDVSEAEDGQQAIQLSGEFFPDVILMDIIMPVMDGYEALKILKANPKTSHIPVIAVTTITDEKEVMKIKQSGFDSYITKPVRMHELFGELSKYLNHSEKDNPIMKSPSESPDPVEENENIPELLRIIESEIMPEWEFLNGAMEIDTIELFAEKLSQLSQIHNYKSLKEYADSLYEYTQGFDVEQIERLLKEFPAICDKMKG
ncbi:MAG: response regulator [Desulfobacterales bacterium]|nr:response regulator [Desulfobacterales bacterium]